MGRARDRASADLNGQEFILDADADTSISADTDDQIDIKIAGQDDFQFTANTFTAQSGSTIAAQALTATTVTASGDLTVDTDTLKVDASEDTVCINTTDTNFDAGADDLIVGSGSGDSGITIYTGGSVGDKGSIFFADATVGSSAEKKGQISYEQNNEIMTFFTNDTLAQQIDANGIITTPKQPIFEVTKGSEQTLSSSTLTLLTFDTEVYDLNSDFDLSNDKFIAPVDGKYMLQAYITTGTMVAGAGIGLVWQKTPSGGSEGVFKHGHSQSTEINITFGLDATLVVDLDAGDAIRLYGYHGSGSNQSFGAANNQFSGTSANSNYWAGFLIG